MLSKSIKLRSVIVAVLGMIVVTSCTQELPYKEVLKEKTYSKSVIDTEAEYLYLPSLQNTTRTSEDALPYWMGNAKLVQFEFTEQKLQVYQLEEDERFHENKANRKLVMEIPITHLKYRCQKDRYGECQNAEEDNYEITWSEKTDFKADFSGLKVVENSYLPVELDQLFGSNCHTERSSRVTDYEVTETDINIEIERTFDVKLWCKSNIETLSDTTETIVYTYSFARRDSIVSKDYEPVTYSKNDENTFGFFATEKTVKDVDFRDIQANETALLNRWNPKRKEVLYYLSPEFKKPKNKLLREATIKGIDRVNDGLRSAKAGFQIILKDAPKDVNPAHIRTSMIVLVEDPTNAGPLGYGPTATDPITGEIVSGRTVMFPGVYLSSIKLSYDQMYEEQVLQKKLAAKAEREAKAEKKLTKLKADPKDTEAKQAKRKVTGGTKSQVQLSDKVLKAMEAQVKDFNSKASITSDFKSRLEIMSEHNYYPSELLDIDPVLTKGVETVLGGELKPWEELTTRQKQAIIDVTLPNLWMSTFIHEVGHNLGLRHNFAGSRDEDNFYTPEELKAMGITHKVPYSSVMDYGGSDLNELKSFGKYDIAALRYGYAREVEVNVEGQTKLVKLDGSLEDFADKNIKAADTSARPGYSARREWIGENLKPYGYCTDEHTGVNANCNRFDEGISRVDVVNFLIKERYEAYYKYFNNRSGRADFSVMRDPGYIRFMENLFTSMRLNFENYEDIKATYNLSDEDAVWEQNEWLKDLKDATVLSARFFMDVIKTPDLTCIIQGQEPEPLVAPMSEIAPGSGAQSCADIELAPGFSLLAQAGKRFHNIKYDDNPNFYIDQIDVRGVAYDKILALEALLNRRIGYSTFDDKTDNYADISYLKDEIMETVTQVVLNDASGVVKATTVDGEDVKLNLPSYQIAGNPVIEKPLHYHVRNMLDLDQNETDLREQFVHIVKREMLSSQRHVAAAQDFALAFDVTVKGRTESFDPRTSAVVYETGLQRYFALPENSVAYESIVMLMVHDNLVQIEQAALEAIIVARQQGEQAPAGVQGAEKFFWQLPVSYFNKLLMGELQPRANYETVLQILGNQRKEDVLKIAL